MQLPNLKTFESGAFEMPKYRGLTDVKIKDMSEFRLSLHSRKKKTEWFMIACLEMDSTSRKMSVLHWLAVSLFFKLFI